MGAGASLSFEGVAIAAGTAACSLLKIFLLIFFFFLI
jgi:hypothetical protein